MTFGPTKPCIVILGNDTQRWAFLVNAREGDDLLRLAINAFRHHCSDVVEADAIDMDGFFLDQAAADYLVLHDYK